MLIAVFTPGFDGTTRGDALDDDDDEYSSDNDIVPRRSCRDAVRYGLACLSLLSLLMMMLLLLLVWSLSTSIGFSPSVVKITQEEAALAEINPQEKRWIQSCFRQAQRNE